LTSPARPPFPVSASIGVKSFVCRNVFDCQSPFARKRELGNISRTRRFFVKSRQKTEK